jgi:hypothetical protein
MNDALKKLSLETLESRYCMDGSYHLEIVGGDIMIGTKQYHRYTLEINGTDGVDQFKVTADGRNVKIEGLAMQPENDIGPQAGKPLLVDQVVNLKVDGGLDGDVIDVSEVSMYLNLKKVELVGGEGNDKLYLPRRYPKMIESSADGGKGDDMIWGGNLDDKIDAGEAFLKGDKIFSGPGNDTVWLGMAKPGGKNEVLTNTGNDTVYGSDGPDKIDGGSDVASDEKLLYGYLGDDNISGGAGDDELVGGLGEDTLHGMAGNDTIYGGEDVPVEFCAIDASALKNCQDESQDNIYGDADWDEIYSHTDLWPDQPSLGRATIDAFGWWGADDPPADALIWFAAGGDDLSDAGPKNDGFCDIIDGEVDGTVDAQGHCTDPIPAVLQLHGDGTVAEGQSATYSLSLVSATDHQVTAYYDVAAYTADANDVSLGSGSVVFSIGQTLATVAVSVLTDSLYEQDESFQFFVKDVKGATINDQVLFTTIQGTASPTINVVSYPTVVEGQSAAVGISLSWESHSSVTVFYSTVTGSANSSDFNSVTGSVIFSPGETYREVSLGTVDDGSDEDYESYSLALTSAIGGVLGNSISEISLVDNDSPGGNANVSDAVSVTEGGSMSFTISLSTSAAQNVTVYYTTTDSGASASLDYTSVAGSVIFAPGETQKVVVVSTNNDAIDEGDESFRLLLTSASGADIFDGEGLAVIGDDDATPVLTVASSTSVTEGGSATIAFTLNSASGREVVVHYRTSGSADPLSDYNSGSGVVRFEPGQVSANVVFYTVDDQLDEVDESFYVSILESWNADYSGSPVTVTILDNDAPPSISIGDAGSITEGSSAAFVVSLSSASGKDVTVFYNTSNGTAVSGTDYSYASGSVVISAGDLSATVTVNTTNDSIDEDDETFSAVLTGATNATLNDSVGVATIIDNDPPPYVNLAWYSSSSVAEGNSIGFKISLSSESGKAVTVYYHTASGTAGSSDFALTTGSVVFTPGQTEQTVYIGTTDDSEDEDDETFSFVLDDAINGTISVGSLVALINDND